MRYSLIILFCVFSLSASAQWYRLNFKKHEVLPLLKITTPHSLSRMGNNVHFNTIAVRPAIVESSLYSVEAQAAMVLKIVKHNMRYRVFHEASYNFSDLAQLYVKLNRLSEAKWFLLQSSAISRNENDDKHTIANLVSLASVKMTIGDPVSARADLVEARNMANAKGMQADAAEINKKIQLLDQSKTANTKPDIKYAENTISSKNTF